MKKIEAIIRRTKFEEVKEALLAADIEWFSYYEVRGVGKTREGRIYRGVVYDTSSIERILISIVVREKNVEKTVQAIMKAAYTGEIGDGRIFIIPVEDSIRIRTGERGDISLYNADRKNNPGKSTQVLILKGKIMKRLNRRCAHSSIPQNPHTLILTSVSIDYNSADLCT